MSAEDDIDALAGEYVLGTLDDGERARVVERRALEPQLDAAIRSWEARLAPLDRLTSSIAPPPDLKVRIEARLDRLQNAAERSSPNANVVSLLEARVRRWRTIAAAASALAASMVVVIGLRETVFAPPAQSYVAVFNNADQAPAFLMTIDLATRQVTVRPVGAPAQPGKTYQLWIASADIGPQPRSLGLIGEGAAPARVTLTAYAPDLLSRATFGVSLEPDGGSPTGQPTSPALHARLLPATN